MMWARLIGSVFILGGGIVSARSANEGTGALELCFQAARIADAICSKLPDEPALRLDCFQKTRSAQLECLEHVLSETPAATPKTPSEATRSEPPANAGPARQKSPSDAARSEPPASAAPATPNSPSETARSEPPASAAPATPNSPPEAPRPEPPASAVFPEGSSERVSPPAQTGTLETPPGIPSAEKSPPKAIVGTNPLEPSNSTEVPTGAIQPNISPKTAEVPVGPTGTNWLISETTSPVDYSPLVTALIRSTSQVKDSPSALAVRCLGKRTELLLRTDGSWTATRGHELRVDYQVNDQPAVGLQWILSSDGKTVTYKDDPVSLFQSLPDGARLKINVADRASSSHEATFQIDGWDVVRNKIGTACKWARRTDKTSSGKR